MASAKKLRLTLVRSTAHRLPAHKACVAGLGLRRMHHSVEIENSPAVWGMVQKVSYLLKVEEV